MGLFLSRRSSLRPASAKNKSAVGMMPAIFRFMHMFYSPLASEFLPVGGILGYLLRRADGGMPISSRYFATVRRES